MKKQIGYRLGYRIIIWNGFYEVTEGKKAVYYGECRKNSTIQEIVNKTIYSDPFCQDSFLTILSLGDRRIFL